MEEKILQKMMLAAAALSAAATAKGASAPSVSERTLKAMAKSLSAVVTTDEQLNALDMKDTLSEFDGNTRHIVAEAVKAAKGTPPTPPTIESPEVKALADMVKTLQSQIQGFASQNAKADMLAKLEAGLKDMPQVMADPIRQSFAHMSFEEPQKFDTYLATITQTKNDYLKAVTEGKLPSLTPPRPVDIPKPSNTTPALDRAREVLRKEKEEKAKQSKTE